ncbi:MAG TPA: ADOP family duplicated permease, partial [Thermoanaerobaculia bacterium]|nr:ADOP family duplicated permease [Thermoanaerobaculia bacterium]
LAFGGVERTREGMREARGTGWIENLGRDLAFGLRLARRDLGLSVTVALTLALGIGATCAVFSVADAVLLAPLPYPEPDRLAVIQQSWEETTDGGLSTTEYLDYADRLDRVEGVGVWVTGPANVTGGERPERVRGAFVSPSLLPVLGVEVARGRGFEASEGLPGNGAVALVGWELWQRRFAGDEAALGQRVRLDGRDVTLVGVLPAGFQLPSDFAATPSELLLPLTADPADRSVRGGHYLGAVVRLRDGVSLDEASEEVAATAVAFTREYPDGYTPAMRFAARLEPLHQEVVGDAGPTLALLLGAAALVLLVACANVAGLLLARAPRRRREMALRAALGASRGRLVAQLFAEAGVLALLGGVLGVGLAVAGVEALAAAAPPGLPRLAEVAVDLRLLTVAAGLAAVSCFAFGVLPALRTVERKPEAQRSVTTGPREGRASQALVVAEVALCLLLLVAGGLLGRSLLELSGVDPGFEPSGVTAVDLSLSGGEYGTPGVLDFYARLDERLGGLAGVEAAGAAGFLPLDAGRGDVNFEIEGRERPEDQVKPSADWQVVTPGYLEALRYRLSAGRLLDGRDREDAPGAAVVNRTLAEAYWPGESPIGARLNLLGGTQPEVATVVGVVEDVKNLGLDAGPQKEIFLAHRQFRFWNIGIPMYDMTVTVRGTPGLDGAQLERAVTRQVHALDPNLPVQGFRTLEEVVGHSLARERFTLLLVGAFSLLALLVAAVGIYGLLAYAVERRLREIGIRRVLGAGIGDVVAATVGRGLLVVAIGRTAGLAVAFLAVRLLTGLLFGIPAHDPVTFVAAPAVLVAVALVASLLPARRALAVDPVEVMRAE